MKNFIIILGILILTFSCYSNKQMSYYKEQEQIQDSIQAARAQMKADDDLDGVINYYDQCDDTPAKARVDAKGCPMDVDQDGIIDHDDKCVTVPGKKEFDGCPEAQD